MRKLTAIITPIFIFLLPLVFWTTTPNFINAPKQLLLILFTLTLLFSWLIHAFRHQTLKFNSTNLTHPLIIFFIALTANLLLTREAKIESLMGLGSIYLASTISALFISNYNSTTLVKRSLISFIASSTLLAIYTIFQLTLIYKLTSLPTFLQSQTFSPAGSPIIAITLFILAIIISIKLTTIFKTTLQQTFLFTSTAILAIAIVAYISLILNNHQLTPLILPFSASWSITLDTLKSTRNLQFGIGFANFPALYTTVKPLFLNQGVFWNILPTAPTAEIFNLIIVGGLLLFIPFIFIIYTHFTSFKTQLKLHSTAKLLATLSLLTFLFTVNSTILIPLSFIFLAFASHSNSHQTFKLNSTLNLSLALITLSFIFTTLFYTVKIVLAEYHLRQSQLSLTKQNAKAVYQHHLQAISLAPKITNYHLSYSRLNLNLASSLSQLKNPTDDQKQQIATLLAQAVREAKYATSLRPSLASTWSNLGYIYRQLINVAQGAEDLTIKNYATAISLDPANPALRLEFGGIFYQLANSPLANQPTEKTQTYLKRAIDEFTTATQLKPNYANAWYNLAKAYELAHDYTSAYQAMQQTIASLEPNSPDLATATQELNQLKNQLPTTTPQPTPQPTTTKDLATPSPLPSPLPNGPINLNIEASNSATP